MLQQPTQLTQIAVRFMLEQFMLLCIAIRIESALERLAKININRTKSHNSSADRETQYRCHMNRY